MASASTWQEAERQRLQNWIPEGGSGIGVLNGKRQYFQKGKTAPNWAVPFQDLVIENPVGLAKGAAGLVSNTAKSVGLNPMEYLKNPGSLGILDPRVWGAMNQSRKNIKDLNLKPIPSYDHTQGADLPEELLEASLKNANTTAIKELTQVQPGSKQEVEVETNPGTGTETGATVKTEIPTLTRIEERALKQASGKGSVAKSKALLKKWKIDRAQQNQESSAINNDGDPVASVNNPSGNNTTKLSYTPTAEQMKIKADQQILKGMSDPRTARARVEAFNSGNLQAIPNEIMNQPIPNYNPGAIKNFATLNKTQMNEVAKLTSGGGGPFSSAAQTSKTLGGISNILGLVAKAQQKEKNPSPSTGTGSPGSFQIPAVTVNPEDFYNLA